ncbi:YqaJ viral recombinase family protein [Ectothiorhodospira haloalkaliphila]|uniref:YqaJ viral recombinase family nuclease n=1 Tax=Ectothiorhodospira haloalkaliphila TaxID=421628 RepID=UPI000A068A4E|nr:YqaJ viral recombinase family protein [Ectothiorhodospira haloalkaliphila]
MSQTQQAFCPAQETLSPGRRHGQARRLVNTRALDHRAWLAIRQSGIGSSDAAAAVGLNPYQSPLTLWMEKTGRGASESSDRRQDRLQCPLHWGTVLEPIVAEHYAQHTGRKVRRVNAILQHTEHSWMLANLDREVVGSEDVQILECKTAGMHGAKLWQYGVPEYVQLQVMHQLAVTGHQAADVAVLIAGQQLEIHRIERDEAMIEQLIALEAQFWRSVEQDVPPPADASDSAGQALRRLYPRDSGQTVDFSDDADLCEVFARLQRVRDELAQRGQEEAQLRHTLQQAMGEATVAQFPTGRVRWKQTAPVNRLNTQALKADHPDLVAAYQKESPGQRRFVMLDS